MNLIKNIKFFNTHTKFRDQYNHHLQSFQLIHKSNRQLQLQKIYANNPIRQPWNIEIPKFPKQQTWEYKNNKYSTYFWEPKQIPKALLITLHSIDGHTGHSGLYAQKLAEKGILVAGYDYLNFGGSSGTKRGKIESGNELIETTQKFIQYVSQRYPLKLYLQGANFGGTLAYHLAISTQSKIAGTIFLNPIFKHNHLIDTYTNLKFIISMILPDYRMFSPHFSSNLSSSYHIEKELNKDQLVYKGRIWGSTYCECKMLQKKVMKQIRQFKSRYLFIQGGSDKIVNPFQILSFSEKTPIQLQTLVFIQDLWHSAYFDPYVQDVSKITSQWILQQL